MKTLKFFLPRVLLAVFAMACPVSLAAWVVNTNPDLLPAQIRPDPLDRRVANDEYRFVFTDLDGDTFRHHEGMVRPPDENRVLEDFTRRYGEDGFRVPALVADHYPIIALGDSFTEGGTTPWPDVLAQTLNVPVRNLGWPGIGPIDEARIMADYGTDSHAWVLLGYFEGNDLGNIESAYRRIQEEGNALLNLTRDVIDRDAEPRIVTNPDGNYLYPLQHNLNGQTYDIAYISDYLWWLNANADTYRQSRNFALLRESLAEIQAEAGDACLALVYIPEKSHIYFPYSDPQGNRRYVLENGLSLRLVGDNWLGFGGLEPVDYEALMANLDNQRDVVRELALQLGWHFIDLTPAFQAAAAEGQLTYYPYDSHWSEAGHTLAGRTVAEYLQTIDSCRVDVE